MALVCSLGDVYANEDLCRLPIVASKYWFYGAFIPWNIGSGSRDEGIYFVMSDEPIPPDIDIRDLTMKLSQTDYLNTKYLLFPIGKECLDESNKAQNLVNETLEYAENIATLRSIFDEFGEGAKIPEFIGPEELRDLLRVYALAQFDDYGKTLESQTAIIETRAAAMKDLRRYCRIWKNVEEKYSKNRILRFFKIPNRDYLRASYELNPRLLWSDNPLVRAVRWLKYRNSQQISKAALMNLAYGPDGVQRLTLYSKWQDPETGKMHKEGTYQEFVKQMAEKYPGIPYAVKKLKPYKGIFVKTKEDWANPFNKVESYEQPIEIMFCKRHVTYIAPLVNRISMTEEYCTEKAGLSLHPKTLDEMKALGDELVVRYIDCSSAVGYNVGILAENCGIPYALDDGTTYASEADESMAFVFRAQDADFAESAIERVLEDFSNTPGQCKYPNRYTQCRSPEPEKEVNEGFECLRDKQIDEALQMKIVTGNPKEEMDLSL